MKLKIEFNLDDEIPEELGNNIISLVKSFLYELDYIIEQYEDFDDEDDDDEDFIDEASDWEDEELDDFDCNCFDEDDEPLYIDNNWRN